MHRRVATMRTSAQPASLGGRDKPGHDGAVVSSARCSLDQHLIRHHSRPLAVALSGGGDSLALTLIVDAWAREAGRELLIFIVDHRLQADSAAWTDTCAATAARLGRPFRELTWEGPKPVTGLPAAARAARHRLLADAAREAGAAVILMGHTADDIVEARAMREAGSTTPDPRRWAPSPAWPQGRGVFLLRPLLDIRRVDLRTWLIERGERWIDDPTNADMRYARSRARAAASAFGRTELAAPIQPGLRIDVAGGLLTVDRAALRQAPIEAVHRLVAMACVCAGGGDRRPAGARIARAVKAMRGADRFVSTLAGARIEADGDVVRIVREPGEAARGGLQSLDLPVRQEVVWDGRFEVTAFASGLVVRPDPRGNPQIVGPDGTIWSETPDVTIRPLVGPRFLAAAGFVDREPP